MDQHAIYGQEQLSDRMKLRRFGRTVRFFECIGSTNEQAKYDAGNGAESGTLVVAEKQTAGKGRRGRVWDSPAGGNIYFSLILKPDFAPDQASMLTLVMALAVAEGIKKQIAGTSEVKIKWPNDIVINGKKVCGILTEMSVKEGRIDYVVIGVGINVCQQDYTGELVDKATSLEKECEQKTDRITLIADIMEAFEADYAIFEEQGSLAGLRESYNEILVNRNREVRVLDPQVEYGGIARGITDTGELCVELPDGRVSFVYAGEVSVRGIYGYV